MREILFRGKRMDNGEWVEGYVFDNDFSDDKRYFVGSLVIEPDGGSKSYDFDVTGINFCEVDPETICQYTGLIDKNGNLIWENDIVKFEDCGEEGYEYKEGFDFENKARVEFTEGRWSLTDFVSDNSAVIDEMYNHAQFMNLWGECEVIGNVFDNPELLEA